MPLFAETKMHEWRKKRDGNTGIATNGRIGPRSSDTQYDDSDISATSNSRWRSMRKNVSSTGSVEEVEVDAVRRDRPSASARVRS